MGAFAFQPDGRIVVAGGAYAGSTTESFSNITTFKSDAVVVRLTAAGQLDSTFGTGGRVSLSTPDFNDAATGVQALADGRVLVVGDFFQSQKPFATRLAADGSVDATYGAGGQADVSGQSAVVALADGRVLRAATAFPFSPGLPTRPATTLARLTAVGQPEPGFNTAANDSVGFDALSPGRAVALPDGGLLLRAGVQSKSDPTQSDQGVVRFVGTTTPSPSPAGTLNVGGAPAGGVTPLRPDAGGAFSPLAALNVYPNSSGAVRTATADVNGDGVPDLVTGVGPGGGSGVVVTDGKTGARLADFSAFEATFTGGVFVAAADLDRDGFAEVVVTPDRGGGPVVAIYDGAGLATGKNAAAELTRFFGIDDNAFRGGARPALGDVNGDGRPRAADGSARLVTGSGEGQPGRVNVDRAATAIAGGPADQVVSPFGDAALADGVYVG